MSRTGWCGVTDALRDQHQLPMIATVNGVQFGAKADEDRKYRNKRCEMWGRLKEELPKLALPKTEQLAQDLTGPEYSFTDKDQIALEAKQAMKARGLASPDIGEAVALTFAVTVPVLTWRDVREQELIREHNERKRKEMLNYNPFAVLDREKQLEHDPFVNIR